MPFFEKKSILQLIVEGLKTHFNDKQIIVVTSNKKEDDIIELTSKKLGVLVFRGDEKNVLSRFVGAAEKFNIDKMIRVCADNPFLDYSSVKHLFDEISDSDNDYIAFCDSKSRPTITLHYGLWAEAVSLSALKDIFSRTTDFINYEHVTRYIYKNPQFYDIKLIQIPKKFESDDVRLTVDTIEDFNLLKKLFLNWVETSKKYGLKIDGLYGLIAADSYLIKSMKRQIKNQEK